VKDSRTIVSCYRKMSLSEACQSWGTGKVRDKEQKVTFLPPNKDFLTNWASTEKLKLH
jgi:hypothetical protein